MGGGGEGKKRGGVKAISDWPEVGGGGGLNFFIKKFRVVSSWITRYNLQIYTLVRLSLSSSHIFDHCY